MEEFKVEDVYPGRQDFAHFPIICVYMFNPPDYAVYRTPSRVMVQFADDKEKAREQRARISPLTPLRGQINALIDGWHTSGSKPSNEEEKEPPERQSPRQPPPQKKNQNRRRADRYDRRVADAISTGLENDVPTALALLCDVKNDIISERTSMARIDYLMTAFALAAVIVLLTLLARASSSFEVSLSLPRSVWMAVCGGTIGAFFSIAIGLKRRNIQIDLQNRDNIADAVLRVLIGAMAGGVLICLLLSGLVQSSALDGGRLNATDSRYDAMLVFVVGFFAGFFERLVPDLLAKTNLGTKEKGGTADPTGATPHTPAPTPAPPTSVAVDTVEAATAPQNSNQNS